MRSPSRPDTTVILKMGAIGDLLMTTPAIRAIRRGLADTRIVLVTGRGMRSVVLNNPDIDDIIIVDDDAIFNGSFIQKVRATVRLVRRIRSLSPARIFVMHKDSRWNLIALLSGVSRRFGFEREGSSRFLTDAVVSNRHELDGYLSVATLMDGVVPAGRDMTVVADEDQKKKADAILKKLDGVRPIIVVAPGGAVNVKMASPLRRWPAERYKSTVQRLTEEFGAGVVIVGGPGDRDVSRFVAGDAKNVVDATGLGSVPGDVELMRSCDAMLTHDSGPMHMAVAAGIPVVALFGPTNPVHTGPTSPRSVVVFRGGHLPCCPCHKDGSYADCVGNECMAAIGVDDAVDAVRSII